MQKPKEPLLKITKIPKEKEDSFEKLRELIEVRAGLPRKRPKELTFEQRKKIRDVWYELSKLIEEENLSPEQKAMLKKELEKKSMPIIPRKKPVKRKTRPLKTKPSKKPKKKTSPRKPKKKSQSSKRSKKLTRKKPAKKKR